MPSKKGLILHTKNKYCNDDFEIVPTFNMSESDIVVKVNELPTTNIDKSKIYLVNDNVVGIPQNYIAYVYDNGWVSVAKIQEDYNLLDEQYKLLFKDYQILETNNTNLQNSYNNLQVENTTLQNDKVVLQNQNTLLNTQNNELQTSVNNLTIENTSLQSTINKLEEDVSYYQDRATDWKNQYNFLMTDYESLSNDYFTLEENYNVVSTEKEELKISNDKLAVQKDAFLGYIEGTKTQLTAEDLDGLTTVRQYAFRSSALTSIIFPNTVKNRGSAILRYGKILRAKAIRLSAAVGLRIIFLKDISLFRKSAVIPEKRCALSVLKVLIEKIYSYSSIRGLRCNIVFRAARHILTSPVKLTAHKVVVERVCITVVCVYLDAVTYSNTLVYSEAILS